ncbi:UNVERIFIED_CONTAM: hypothetical protein RMT77_011731 [Armadillidium vulgare]
MKHLMPRIYVVESKGLNYPEKIGLVLGVTGAVGILALSAAGGAPVGIASVIAAKLYLKKIAPGVIAENQPTFHIIPKKDLFGEITAGHHKNKISAAKLEEAFDKFDTDEDAFVSSKELLDIFEYLGVNITFSELGHRYEKLEKRSLDNSSSISFKVFMTLFHITLLDPKYLMRILTDTYMKIVTEKGKCCYFDVVILLPALNINVAQIKVLKCFTILIGSDREKPLTFEEYMKLFGIAKANLNNTVSNLTKFAVS